MEQFFAILSSIEEVCWQYIGVPLIVLTGAYFTIKTKGYQFRTIVKIKRHFKELHQGAKEKEKGVNPLKLYFASMAGMIGIGNIAGIITAITLGGPGAIFWMWVASFAGMLIKYSEIYLGVSYRVHSNSGGYDGGPMYYLRAAFNSRFVPIMICVLLCIYGVEIYQFTVLTDTVTNFTKVDRPIVIGVLLVLIFYSALGGVSRLANICSTMMPPFLVIYIGMCAWVMFMNISELGNVFLLILKSAFTGHAALGGFAGSTFLMAAQYGISKAVYSGDIGIGYDSIVQSETKIEQPETQARMAIVALFSDTLICTLSCFVALCTGIWTTTENILPSEYVSRAFAMYIPYTDVFILALFFIAATGTVIGYLVIGLKCAKYINQKWGEKIYIVYSILALIFFAYHDQTQVMLIMSVCSGFLVLVNVIGIVKLRKLIKFK